jgi:hypothetical protein
VRRVISLAVVPAAAPCSSRRAEPAGPAVDAAPGTEGEPAQRSTSEPTLDAHTLAAIRPRTWGDCEREGWGAEGPCPWVGCTQHLLLEVRTSEKKGQGLRIYAPQGRGAGKVWRPSTEQGVDLMVEHAVSALADRTDSCCAIREGMKGETTLRRIQKLYSMASTHAAEQLLERALGAFEAKGGGLEDVGPASQPRKP